MRPDQPGQRIEAESDVLACLRTASRQRAVAGLAYGPGANALEVDDLVLAGSLMEICFNVK